MKGSSLVSNRSSSHFHKGLFLLAFAFMVFLALRYSLCWQDFDIPHKFFPMALRNGPDLKLEDFTRIFNVGRDGYKIGPPTRLRYFQDLVSLLDIKFRIWLFNYIPPHPSATLAWLFVFFFSPYMMFKLVKQLTRNRSAAWTAVILFILSTGNLFGVNKMSNPAKPLANFFCLLVFYLAAVVNTEAVKRVKISRRGRYFFVVMLIVLFISFFTDETSWMFYFMIPILFPGVFIRKPARRFTIPGYLLLLLLAAFFVFVGFPFLLRQFSPGEVLVDYSQDLAGNSDIGPLIPPFFGLRYILLTARNLIWTQLVPWGWYWWGGVYLAGLAIYLVFQYLYLSAPWRKLILRLLVVFSVFIVLQSFAIAKVYWESGYILKYPLYYGALFSVFLSIPLAILLSGESRKYSRIINRSLLVLISLVLAHNFLRMNEDIRFLQALWENAGEMDYATSRAIWKERKNPEAIRRYKSQYPIWSAWAYIQEIGVIANQHSAKKNVASNHGQE